MLNMVEFMQKVDVLNHENHKYRIQTCQFTAETRNFDIRPANLENSE